MWIAGDSDVHAFEGPGIADAESLDRSHIAIVTRGKSHTAILGRERLAMVKPEVHEVGKVTRIRARRIQGWPQAILVNP